MAEDKTNGVPDELTEEQKTQGLLNIIRRRTPGDEDEVKKKVEAYMKRIGPPPKKE